VGPKTWGSSDGRGDIKPVDGGPSVPAQERQIVEDGKLGDVIESPAKAKDAAEKFVKHNGGRPVIILMDAQHLPVAVVPWAAGDAMPLKDNGKLNALHRAAAHANAGAALIATGVNQPLSMEQAQNLGAGLSQMDVRVIDIIDGRGRSAVERGDSTKAATLRAVALPAVATGLAASAAQPTEEEEL
jgi:hypothetical protein